MTKATNKQIIDACAQTLSMSEAAKLVGLHLSSFIPRAKKLGVYKPNQHGISMTRQKYLEDSRSTLEDIFSGEVFHNSSYIKKRLIEAGLKQPICELCGQDENWHGGKLTLELDHKDGNNRNNQLNNLRIVCPNCHSTTPTWRGRNRQINPISDSKLLKALQENETIHKALLSLGMTPKGANYKRAKKLCPCGEIGRHP